jgi:hypothetical protein
MLAKREKILLIVLSVAAAAAAVSIILFLGSERIRTAQSRAAEYRKQIEKLSHSTPPEAEVVSLRDRLAAEYAAKKASFYSADEMNPYSFGTIIKKELTSRGITVVRYQVVESQGKSSLEFSVTGSVRSLILFLKQVSESDKFWTISSFSLSMREGTEIADSTFRIGYEVIDTEN